MLSTTITLIRNRHCSVTASQSPFKQRLLPEPNGLFGASQAGIKCASVDLALEAAAGSDGMVVLNLQYNADLYAEATGQRMAAHLLARHYASSCPSAPGESA